MITAMKSQNQSKGAESLRPWGYLGEGPEVALWGQDIDAVI